MKNSAIKKMVCDQYNCEEDKVSVEFLSYVDGEYTFNVVVHEDDVITSFELQVKSIFN